MKKKIVLWGTDEADKKILVALELLAKENKVNIYTFNEETATEEFFNSMMDEWRVGKEIEFPENTKVIEKPLSMTDELLPESIKVQRGDVINRAKTEWHFVVLSTKLYDLYKSELEDLKEKVARLNDFDGGVFEEMKSFWAKVAEQSREKNLFREHAERLKAQTNEIFGKLKELRSKANAEFSKVSKENLKQVSEKLEVINGKIEKGLGLSPLFDELKNLQSEIRDIKFTKEDRNKIWKRIDEAFKSVKEKKFGKQSDNNSKGNRLDRRYQGLLSAIEKMEKSIGRDQKDIEFQNRRVNQTDGQLEMQIRQAKIKMIEERISSKNEKLQDMLKTKLDLEKKMEKEEAKKAKLQEKEQIEQKKKELKDKIATEISEKSEDLDDEKLKKAAAAMKEEPKKAEPKKESLLGAIATVATETFEDVVDTVKAVSEVVEDKMEKAVDNLNIEEKIENAKEAVESIKDNIEDKVEQIAKDLKVEEKIEEMKETAENIKDKIEDKIEEVKDKVTGEAEATEETVSEAAEEVEETLELKDLDKEEE